MVRISREAKRAPRRVMRARTTEFTVGRAGMLEPEDGPRMPGSGFGGERVIDRRVNAEVLDLKTLAAVELVVVVDTTGPAIEA
jgi:hypothetical protein